MQTCSSGQWGVCVGDQTPSNELCDGLDNDCDGNPDDGNPEGGGSCSTGLPGVCAPGHLQCLSAQLSCVQDVQPSADVCNNLDDDCDPSTPDGSDDGAVGVPCDGPDGDLCAEGLSVCNAGVIGCNDSTGNTLDVCNNADDDCDPSSPDGSEDPQNGMACDGPDSDLCQEGTMSCVSGTLVCSDNTGSTLDVCDGIDNDCDPASADGSEDPQNGAACDGPDSDLCLEGTQSCVNGSLACSDTTGSTLDVCDGIDNDCDSASADGSEDPQNGAGCDGPDTDLCDEGTQSCVSGSFVCSDNTGNNVELCNGIDDDCNSATADGSGDPQVGTACDGNDTDLCAEGTRFCSNGMLACNDNTGNNLDVCNGGDDDCNPATADGSAESWYGAACDGNDVDVCAEGTFGCVSGSQVCSDNTGDSNIILDTSFEAGFMGGVWTESSSNFGSPICDTASCPLGGGTGPRTGSNWAWFGGIDANETGIVSQVRVIPTGTATLTFWLEIPVCDGTGGTDTFTVRMDGNIVFTRTNTHSSCNLLGYSKQTVSVSAYADGGSHTIEFRGVFSASGTGVTNFFVDDVRLEPCP
jgi:hypothetical protein